MQMLFIFSYESFYTCLYFFIKVHNMILERTSWTLRTMWPTGPTFLPKSWKIPCLIKSCICPKSICVWGEGSTIDDTIKIYVREAILCKRPRAATESGGEGKEEGGYESMYSTSLE